MQDLFKQLIQYECGLHHRDRQNFQILDQRLHPDFKEITKSGWIVHKAQMIEALLNDTDSDIIQAQDFQVQSLSDHSVLLTYQSHQINVATQAQYNVALRSSIWVMNDHGIWQMIFHQGTTCAFEK
ncbi:MULTISPECIES: DUF4440 domain-containing protein [Acinetobacter]|jgi:hypothetical protein|uniref:nuclear transport factor 2 family protein n=1 Tax=Acinetobacter TaxID=469 RepID=UPI0004D3A2BF|nr:MULTISPECIES: DUF4440 domain-containing protein [Acinetobacter]KEC86285.1 hypothetical protein DT74_00105 [Acinetobacter sp. ETR1]MCG7222455.1 DUF4440 domain-containing protein [Acinetobacter sp. AG3]MDI1222250.1 DUF4440 domain-containing protein [Acinetobacter sp.]WEE39049.1 DUF4440 domain-containing protein [Acinetobacter sp. TAC-1]